MVGDNHFASFWSLADAAAGRLIKAMASIAGIFLNSVRDTSFLPWSAAPGTEAAPNPRVFAPAVVRLAIQTYWQKSKQTHNVAT
ncbi:hypothetical protein [Pannonibacter phragmitetus]|uniref:hypothetical protein n=1 Tax=Pannonibacter phragmitetus TaxID=121719 RepID=UPI001FCAFD2F|nr:hypothetical protein [Pannonibacter phragmitetus]